MSETKCIAVFGGSGKTGTELIKTALGKGFKVKALYRPGTQPAETPKGLEVITGQVNDPADIRRAIEGADAVSVVFGPRLGRGQDPKPFTAGATASITAEMKKLGIQRLVVQTGAMVRGNDGNLSLFVLRFARSYRKKFPAIADDRDEQEKVTKESGLDWTLVRPFRISGARGKGHPRIAPAIHIGLFTSIRRSDLAEFHVNELIDGKYRRQIVYIVS